MWKTRSRNPEMWLTLTFILVLTLSISETDSSTNVFSSRDRGHLRFNGRNNGRISASAPSSGRSKRHTPFMPEDHWKGAPEFGATRTNLTVMVNGTVDIRCPIGHVMDSAVRRR